MACKKYQAQRLQSTRSAPRRTEEHTAHDLALRKSNVEEQEKGPGVVEASFKYFLCLPQEIRDPVYGFLFPLDPNSRLLRYPRFARSAKGRRNLENLRKYILIYRRFHVSGGQAKALSESTESSIFLVNKQVHSEAQEVFFRTMTFTNNINTHHPYDALHPQAWISIRKLELPYDYLERDIQEGFLARYRHYGTRSIKDNLLSAFD